jgi:hypothetical protein
MHSLDPTLSHTVPISTFIGNAVFDQRTPAKKARDAKVALCNNLDALVRGAVQKGCRLAVSPTRFEGSTLVVDHALIAPGADVRLPPGWYVLG